MSQYVTRSDYLAFAIAEPLTTPEARQALCYAFPYTEVVDGVFGGRGRQSRGAVPDTIQGHNPETFQYTTDLEQARDLLATAAVPEGTTLSVAIESGIERDRATMELFQANLAEIGINLDIQQLDLPTMTAMAYGDSPPEERPNMMKWFWWPDYNDAWNHLYPQITCESGGSAGANLGFYCNASVDELMATARDAPNDQTYLDAIGEVQQIISFDDPSAIYYVEIPWTVQFLNEITGIFINPINIGTYNFWAMQRSA
jgi:peptide/nickel transport system substrate-binding protein